jgi:hypothetical protein
MHAVLFLENVEWNPGTLAGCWMGFRHCGACYQAFFLVMAEHQQ